MNNNPLPMGGKKKGAERRALLRRSLAMVPKKTRNLLILCCIFGTAFSLATPLLIGTALDQVLRLFGQHPGNNPFMRTMTLLLGAFLLSALLGLCQGRIGAKASQQLARNIRSRLFHKVLHLPLYYLDTHQHGDIMSRLLNDVENLSGLLPQVLCSFLSAGLSIGACLVLIFKVAPALMWVNIVTVAVSLLVTTMLSRKVFEAAIRQQRTLGRTNSHVTDAIANFSALRMLRKKKDIFHDAKTISDQLAQDSFRLQYLRGLLEPLMMTFGNLGFFFVIVIGCVLVAEQTIHVGALQSAILYSRQFVKSINDLSDLFSKLQVSLSSADRIFELADQPQEEYRLPESASQADPACFASDIQFTDVSFSYTRRKPVLDQLTVRIPAGKTTALVGATGAGKTTIANLLLRFYSPDQGAILFGETDLQQIPLRQLRENFAIALQDTYIVDGTVYDNIMYGCSEPSMEKCVEAARKAHLHERIEALPWKYHTPMSNSDCHWSIGERQLLSVARILAMDPSIVVIDEAMSSIDPRTELEVNEVLTDMMKGRTCIVIAHRLSTIRHADQILVLEGGHIVESGTHDELRANHAQYDRLYRHLNA